MVKAGSLARTRQRAAALWSKPAAGLLLLVLAFATGYLFRYVGVFTADEGDNISIGFLLSKGYILYRDVFTHHLPFPYFWIAAVARLVPTIKAIRLSILFFQLASFAGVMYLTRAYGPVGLAALLWSAVGHQFYANMAILNVFSGAALAVVFTGVVVILLRQAPLGWKEMAFLGICAGLALLTDPLSALAIAVCAAALAASRTGLRRLVPALVSFASVLVVFLIYLLFTASLDDFYRDVILFNATVYSKFYEHSLAYLLDFPRLLVSGLWIFNADQWMQPERLFTGGIYSTLARYLAGWFIFRFAIIAFSLSLLFKKKWLAGGFVYLFATSLLIRSDGFFRQIPLILAALLCAAWLLFDTFHLDRGDPGERAGDAAQGSRIASNRIWRIASGSIIALILTGFLASTLLYRYQNQNTLSYFDRFGAYESRAAEIKALACDQNVALGYYPCDPLIYFYTGFRPVSRYVYLWPWVAEVGLPDVLDSLQTEKAIIFVDQETSIWGIPATDYLGSLIAYLNANYVPLDGFYLSPGLAAECGL